MLRTCLLLSCCLVAIHAADLLRFDAGAATADGAALVAGQGIDAGQLIACDAGGPCRLVVPDAGGSSIVLAAGSSARFAFDGNTLICNLEQGSVQNDLPNLGTWTGYRVVGGYAEASVKGTLFVVERRRGADHIAVIHGQVGVRLRRAVAAALGEDQQDIDLKDRQQISASKNGLSAVTALDSRPQLASLEGLEGDPWLLDAAARWLAEHPAGLDQSAAGLAGEIAGAAGGDSGVPGAGTAAANSLRDDLRNHLLDEVRSEAVNGREIMEEVIRQHSETLLDGLPGPPL